MSRKVSPVGELAAHDIEVLQSEADGIKLRVSAKRTVESWSFGISDGAARPAVGEAFQ